MSLQHKANAMADEAPPHLTVQQAANNPPKAEEQDPQRDGRSAGTWVGNRMVGDKQGHGILKRWGLARSCDKPAARQTEALAARRAKGDAAGKTRPVVAQKPYPKAAQTAHRNTAQKWEKKGPQPIVPRQKLRQWYGHHYDYAPGTRQWYGSRYDYE
ncbi:hypothetical protein B0A55_00478 [Friedmanniomyces simplex]|uniref:Uncharacterized protein n=1 Tax=Friedmanniomyces simplex TaxID=329884 RepID=A0A4U0Y770_9PEZI|nr:hypothetical protein B0A55_00478 [Friedmanniomyces simplex]